jgi:FixJ family two-component response regulator
MENEKKILLIDSDDARRKTRVHLLTGSGYTVDLRNDYISAEHLDHEGGFDLIILALNGNTQKAIEYSDQLNRRKPRLPILLLTDFGVYVPPGILSQSIEAGDPAALIREIASMLEGSTHVRELPIPVK